MGVFEHWPNRITALRFVGAVLLFGIFAWIGDGAPVEHRGWLQVAFWLFVVTAATDFLDGWLARRNKTVTAFGRIADPFTDKILIVGALIFLAEMDWSGRYVPAWMVVVIVAREFLVTGIRGYVESVGGAFPADWFGKVKMIVQCIAVGAIVWVHAWAWPDGWHAFWRAVALIAVWLTLLTTVASGLSYVLRTKRILAETGR